MRKFFAIFLMAVVCLGSFFGCSAQSLKIDEDINALYFIESELPEQYGCGFYMSVGSQNLSTSLSEDLLTVVFAKQVFKILTGEQIAVSYNGEDEFTQSLSNGISLYANRYVGQGAAVQALVYADTKEGYLRLLQEVGSFCEVEPLILNITTERYVSGTQGVYNKVGYEVPYPVAAWYDDYAVAYNGQGSLGALWNDGGVGLVECMTRDYSAKWFGKAVFGYLLLSQRFNYGGTIARGMNGLRNLEWASAVSGEREPFVTEGIGVYRLSQLSWAWLLIGIGITAVIGVLFFLVYKFRKKTEPQPIPPQSIDPFDMGSDTTVPKQDQSSANPFGQEYNGTPKQ